jgi:hypothetical protein
LPVQRVHSRNHFHARGYGNDRDRDHGNRVCGRLTWAFPKKLPNYTT